MALAAAGALAYVAVLRRSPPRLAVRFPTFPLALAVPAARHRRRHIAGAVFAAGSVLALLAAAGPLAPLPTPTGLPAALIIDISRSMEETDIPPSRIEAAKAAAIAFTRRLPRASPLALVTFGDTAAVVVPSTHDRARMVEGIASLTTQLRTQLGTGLLEGVRAVAGEGGVSPTAGGVRAVAVLL